MNIPPTLAIVVPCYNESAVFPQTLHTLGTLLHELITTGEISADSYLLFIDDGSRDDTWQQIAAAQSAQIRGIKLSRNAGHQTALMAGLAAIDSDISISIDADLQDDITCIPKMIAAYKSGSDIVYGVRNDRSSDSAFKKYSANSYYKIMGWLGVQQIPNHADYRLMSRRAVNALLSYKENNLYLRGMIPLLGFPSSAVYYQRKERLAGESKYPLRKMLALALEGITSHSIIPLRLISLLGITTSLITFFVGIYAISVKFGGGAVDGWTSLILSIFFLGGVQLVCLGIIGEYTGKIYLESKHRPKYFIEAATFTPQRHEDNNGGGR